MEFLENLGDANVVLIIGAITGIAFGVFAQQSKFCLRSATIEFWQGNPGNKLAIWLLAFSAALFATQVLVHSGTLATENIRQLTGIGSLSGAIVGGAMFGVGMMLARGCASRLLILSATGNLRAFITGLILTIAAQAALTGFLSPMRENVASWWTISGSSRSLELFLPNYSGLVLAIALFFIAITLCRFKPINGWVAVSAFSVGLVVAFGWWATNWHTGWSFEAASAQSVTFTGPSTDTLMALIVSPDIPRTFGTGLVPGVFVGALLAAVVTRQFTVQRFDSDSGMVHYLVGAVLMGFGSMLAGGCAVGAGMTGGAVLATTAWLALLSMWVFAGITDWLLRRSNSIFFMHQIAAVSS